jgi:CheY-like chemotaxis protein
MKNLDNKGDRSGDLNEFSILCVDDDQDILFVTKLALEISGRIKVVCAHNANDALRLLVDSNYHTDCILLDVVMPFVDGRMLFDEILAIPRYKDTPVIFLTARVQGADMSKFIRLGARGVIFKPFDPLTLAEKVISLIVS